MNPAAFRWFAAAPLLVVAAALLTLAYWASAWDAAGWGDGRARGLATFGIIIGALALVPLRLLRPPAPKQAVDVDGADAGDEQ